MSFHGGLLGVMAAVFLFAARTGEQEARDKRQEISEIRNNNKPTCRLSLVACHFKNAFGILDMIAVVAPIGLFSGRLANFINMEVMGRATARPWGVVFAGTGDAIPRHPSPLYEAALEGIVLFIVMFCLWKWTRLRERAGALSGIFAMLYAAFRIFAEQFRQPDAQLGFLAGGWLTMGMLLSAIMIIAGIGLLLQSRPKSRSVRARE
jgi:phosphatidylglycerol:prolipoprotein diacylglycerol transferase